jgi:hypothetical protein
MKIFFMSAALVQLQRRLSSNLLSFKPYHFDILHVGTTNFSFRRRRCYFDCVSFKWGRIVFKESI